MKEIDRIFVREHGQLSSHVNDSRPSWAPTVGEEIDTAINAHAEEEEEEEEGVEEVMEAGEGIEEGMEDT